MECIAPHCAGTLRTGKFSGFCTFCRLPVSACTRCGCWNRPFAVFCRQCGQANTTWQATDPVDPQALRADPRRTVIPQPITTQPHSIAGYLWALGEQGDLYRLNPHAHPGEQLEVHDRFWADPQPHAFCVRRLQTPFGQPAPSPGKPTYEDCAIIATQDRILVYGLYSRQRRAISPLPGETFLVNSRDEYQFLAADNTSLYALSRNADQTTLHHTSLDTGESTRIPLVLPSPCGPILLANHNASHAVIWSSTTLSVFTAGILTPIPLPEAIRLQTSPIETALHISPGRSPAIAASGQLFLPATQFNRRALLRLTPGPTGWSTTVIPVTEEGTLSQTTIGQPLLSTQGKLLACTGPSFRTLVNDNQIAPRFPAWSHETLAIFFCEADYQGLKQWLKAYAQTTEIPISWNLPPNAEVHATNGFWTSGTALCTVCVLAERSLRTEFISWCA